MLREELKAYVGMNSQTPDLVTTLPLTGQCQCGRCWDSECWDSVGVVNVVARQVHDLPAMSVQVVEYRAEVKICLGCSKREQAAFPVGMNGYVQYDPNIMGMVTYFYIEHHMPLFRTHQILGDIYGAWLSEGTIFRALNIASEQLVGLEFDQKLSAAFMAGFQPRLEAVLIAHPEKPPFPKGFGERGNHRVKQHPARTFALRLLTHKEASLRFLMNETCPFNNNQAERDIRRFCIRRKISGDFRTEESAHIVCRLMSYTSCVRKQGGSVWNGIRSLFSEIPLMPSFIPAKQTTSFFALEG